MGRHRDVLITQHRDATRALPNGVAPQNGNAYKGHVPESDNERTYVNQCGKPATPVAQHAGSERQRPVTAAAARNPAPSPRVSEDRGTWVPMLFTTPLEERRRHALPVLRALRESVRHGTSLLDALMSYEGERLHREYARHALVAVTNFGLSFDVVLRERDLALLMLDRAIKRCSPLQVVHGGGWSVTGKRSA